MEKIFIVTGSVTWAMRCRDLLRNHGYNASVKKDTKLSVGCGYGVSVSGDKNKIIEILGNGNIKYRDIIVS